MRKESKSMGARDYAMSDFSPTLVLQTSIAKSPNDMANVQIKSEKLTPFGGIFPIMVNHQYSVPTIYQRVSRTCI